jgi:hypothetical protein
MKRLLPVLAIFLMGLIIGLILPADWRGKLSRPLAAVIRQTVEQMPDD